MRIRQGAPRVLPRAGISPASTATGSSAVAFISASSSSLSWSGKRQSTVFSCVSVPHSSVASVVSVASPNVASVACPSVASPSVAYGCVELPSPKSVLKRALGRSRRAARAFKSRRLHERLADQATGVGVAESSASRGVSSVPVSPVSGVGQRRVSSKASGKTVH